MERSAKLFYAGHFPLWVVSLLDACLWNIHEDTSISLSKLTKIFIFYSTYAKVKFIIFLYYLVFWDALLPMICSLETCLRNDHRWFLKMELHMRKWFRNKYGMMLNYLIWIRNLEITVKKLTLLFFYLFIRLWFSLMLQEGCSVNLQPIFT